MAAIAHAGKTSVPSSCPPAPGAAVAKRLECDGWFMRGEAR